MAGEEERAIEEEDENNTDYESDPEEVKLSLKMRRREASDDEQSADNDDELVIRDIRSEIVVSDDDQGGADDYDDGNDVKNEEDDDGDVYYDDYDEVEVEVVGEEIVEYSEAEEKDIGLEKAENGGTTEVSGETRISVKGGGEEGEGEKKEVEPFSVPTSGAFYMHDDRFRGNVAGGRNRRTFGGRKLWESKDARKWGHDKFEELNLRDRHYDEGRRSSRGSHRGRGRARGASGGYSRGSRVREYSENINQSAPPKDVRGRGPRRYQPLKNNKGETDSPQYKQSGKSFDKNSYTGSGRNALKSFDKKSYSASARMSSSTESSNVEHEVSSAKKVGSNLSSASPPFYPSGASTKDVASAQRMDLPTGNHIRNMRPSGNPNFPMPIADTNMRGKNAIDPTGSTKTINNLHLQSSISSLSSPNQLAHPRGQGRVVTSSRPAMFQPVQTNNLVNKVSPQATQGQSPLQAPGQQLSQRPLVASQSLSPPKAGKGGAIRGTGSGSLGYGGAHVMESGGNVGAGNGDPNIPAFFPVMQFGGQHPGGMGVPAVGMAVPGYVAQPNGLGSSEMTWLPMLASAAGALGATYCPPYLAVDNNYHSRPTGQTPALPAPSKDNTLGELNGEIKHQQRSGVSTDEFSQRQNNSRRYSKMNISQ